MKSREKSRVHERLDHLNNKYDFLCLQINLVNSQETEDIYFKQHDLARHLLEVAGERKALVDLLAEWSEG